MSRWKGKPGQGTVHGERWDRAKTPFVRTDCHGKPGAMHWLRGFLKGKWLKHPLHPVVAHFPVGLWSGVLVFDLLSLGGIGGNAVIRVAFYSIALGLAATVLAVPTGVVDWQGVKKENPAWKLGLYHMSLNLVVAAIFAVNIGLRMETYQVAVQVETPALMLSTIGVVLLLVSAYLGGLMVFDRGISVGRLSKDKWRRIAEASGANLPPQKEK
jgi:uncharacterized membrane protein